ncbi:MAG: hypothetical protein U1F43_18170 [Myxococcota bacterium]
MALRLTDKAGTLLKLLMGLRHADVRRAVYKVGYTQEKIREGWQLLEAASGSRLDRPENVPTPKDDGAIAELDAWENDWYPVIEATLKFNFPKVHAVVFQGLVQTTGRELLVTVPKLLARLAAAPDDAKKLLAERKVTSEVLAKPQSIITHIQESADAPEVEPVDPDAVEKELLAAEDAMWSHYLEWSAIIRAQVKRPRYLQLMGLGGTPKKAGDAPVATDDADTEGETDTDK